MMGQKKTKTQPVFLKQVWVLQSLQKDVSYGPFFSFYFINLFKSRVNKSRKHYELVVVQK